MLIESRDLLELIEKNAYDVVQRSGSREKGMVGFHACVFLASTTTA